MLCCCCRGRKTRGERGSATAPRGGQAISHVKTTWLATNSCAATNNDAAVTLINADYAAEEICQRQPLKQNSLKHLPQARHDYCLHFYKYQDLTSKQVLAKLPQKQVERERFPMSRFTGYRLSPPGPSTPDGKQAASSGFTAECSSEDAWPCSSPPNPASYVQAWPPPVPSTAVAFIGATFLREQEAGYQRVMRDGGCFRQSAVMVYKKCNATNNLDQWGSRRGERAKKTTARRGIRMRQACGAAVAGLKPNQKRERHC